MDTFNVYSTAGFVSQDTIKNTSRGRVHNNHEASEDTDLSARIALAGRLEPGKHLRAHLEAARCLYNALLGEANKRLSACARSCMGKARAIPRSKKQERAQAFSGLRKKYHFSEYELHEYAKACPCLLDRRPHR